MFYNYCNIICSLIKQARLSEDKIVFAPIVFQGKLDCFVNIETLFVALINKVDY
jgi:hypothetical protein